MFSEPRGVVVVPIKTTSKAHRNDLRVYYEVEAVVEWVIACCPGTTTIIFDACYAACGVLGPEQVGSTMMLTWPIGHGARAYGCNFAQLAEKGGAYAAIALAHRLALA